MLVFKDKLSKDKIVAVVKYVREVIQSKADKKGGGHKH